MVTARLITRPLRFASVLARHGVGSLLDRLPRRGPGRLLPPAESGPHRLRRVLQELGGVMVKFGQVLALQPDILPRAYCDALFDLIDRMPELPFVEVERVVVAELGQPLSELFESFEPRPLAAASIAQVHRARFAGRAVAVKVRRPSTDLDFAPDLAILRALHGFLRAVLPARRRWLPEMIREFIQWTESELDFRNEARILERVGHSAARARRRVPSVVRERSGARVLTAELLDGPTLLQAMRAAEGGVELPRALALGFEPQVVATALIENFVADALGEGVFHADLHPANLLILAGNAVGYVDFGISGVLSPYARRELLRLALSYAQGDLDGVAESYLALVRREADSDEAAFHRGLAELAEDWYDEAPGRRRLRKSFAVVFLEITALSRRTNLWPAREVLTYFRSVVTLDGLIRRFAPGVDVSADLEAACARLLRDRLAVLALSPQRMVTALAAGAELLTTGAVRWRRELARRSERRARRARRPTRGPGNVALLVLLALVAGLAAWLTPATMPRAIAGEVSALGALVLSVVGTVARRSAGR